MRAFAAGSTTAAEDAWQSARRAVTARGRASREQLLEATSEQVTDAVRRAITDLEAELNGIAQRVQRTDLSALTDAEVVQLRLDFDSEIDAIASEKEAQLDAIAEQLRAIAVDPDDFGQIITQLGHCRRRGGGNTRATGARRCGSRTDAARDGRRDHRP